MCITHSSHGNVAGGFPREGAGTQLNCAPPPFTYPISARRPAGARLCDRLVVPPCQRIDVLCQAQPVIPSDLGVIPCGLACCILRLDA